MAIESGSGFWKCVCVFGQGMFLYRHWCRGRMICCMSDGVLFFLSCLPHSIYTAMVSREGIIGRLHSC